MTDSQTLVEFLGWCTLINYGLLLFSTLILHTPAGKWGRSIHGRLFGLKDSELDSLYFRFLANYKLLIFVFNLVPYLVLRFLI